jgi:4-amino-4-deoxy-L-arabinose transferase-like glycosyltransferase
LFSDNRKILAILAVALIVRLVAIDHGFPYIYHPDEPAVVRSALGLRFDPNPHHFDWPHLYFYLNYFAYMAFAKIRELCTAMGLRSAITQIAPVIYNDKLIFYLISRILSATLGAFTVLPIYLWVRKLVNRNAGIIASAFLALAPFHVRHSHYALIDVPMLFFLAWSLFFSTFSPILAGLFLGFSASTKYNGILGGLYIALFYLLQKSKPMGQRVIDILKLGVFTVAGFIIGTPYALLSYKTFIRTDGPQGALWQFTNVGKVPLPDQIRQFFLAIRVKLPDDLGYGIWLVLWIVLIVLAIRLVQKKQLDTTVGLTAAVLLVLLFYVSGLKKFPSHYYMIIYPYFFLVIGWALSLMMGKVKQPLHKAALIGILVTPSLILSIFNITDLITKRSPEIFGGDIKENARINP